MLFVPLRNAMTTVTQKLAERPRDLVFAPEHSLLANLRHE